MATEGKMSCFMKRKAKKREKQKLDSELALILRNILDWIKKNSCTRQQGKRCLLEMILWGQQEQSSNASFLSLLNRN